MMHINKLLLRPTYIQTQIMNMAGVSRSVRKWGVVLLSLVLFIQCESDDVLPDDSQSLGSVHGIVVDTLLQPLTNAIIAGGSKIAFTDKNGYFNLDNIPTGNAVRISISSEGFSTYESFPEIVKDAATFIIGCLMPFDTIATIDTGSGLGFARYGSAILLSENSRFENEGFEVIGEVDLRATILTQNRSKAFRALPGHYKAISSRAKKGYITIAGALIVEPKKNDNLLQFDTKTQIRWTLPVPGTWSDSLAALADPYYFDLEKGVWQQEGTSNVKDSTLSVNIPRAGIWCFARFIGEPASGITGLVNDAENKPIKNALVIAQAQSGASGNFAITNKDGTFDLPLQENFTFDIFALTCLNTKKGEVVKSNIVSISTGTSQSTVDAGILTLLPYAMSFLETTWTGIMHFPFGNFWLYNKDRTIKRSADFGVTWVILDSMNRELETPLDGPEMLSDPDSIR